MIMQKLKLNYAHNNSVAQIILDDGKGNVLDHTMMEELQRVLDSFAPNNNLKLITFEGAGKHFSFGASVEEHQKEFAGTMLYHFHKLFYTLRDLSIPTLAKISGQCLGGGMELAIACNFLFAERTANLAQPEIILGVFPPPASIILPLKIGNAKAEELLITGRAINAEEGKTIGLINEVLDDKASLNTFVDSWIEKNILPKSASSLRYAVKAVRTTFNDTLSNKLSFLEQMYVQELMQTKDANEGITAFIEKRKSAWKNC